MKELQSILAAFAPVRSQGKSAVLATVVKTTGSTYRRPGARLLVTEEGQAIGSVSGGCLERDVFRQARRVMQTRKPVLVRYDSMSEEDLLGGFGLGCNGIVEVLIEPLPQDSKPGQMDFLDQCLRLRQAGVLATVFAVAGEIEAEAGCRLMLREGMPAASDIADSVLNASILGDALRVLASGDSQIKVYETVAGRAEVFVERIEPPQPLVIFGAGHDAIPLVRLAKEIGWHVTLVDGRPGYATRARFPAADALIVARPDAVEARVPLDCRAAGVVMNHNYLDDLAVLKALLSSPVRYIGVLGPKRRTERLLGDLDQGGATMRADQLAHLHSPAGIDIGADTPEEIALAILAEIKAVIAGRAGGMCRERQRPLHEHSQRDELITVAGSVAGEVSCRL
jgi:xanthine dehydrogenase accessory factor